MDFEYLKNCKACNSDSIIPVDLRNNICRCGNCGYIFLNPRPSREEIKSYYSRPSKYDHWLGEEKARDLLWQKRLKLIKKYKKCGNLLDIGAGIGQFLYIAKGDFSVTGTEVSKSAISIAKQKYGINVIEGEIDQINLSGSCFDVVTLFHVLEHVADPVLCIKKCREAMKDDGVLIVAVPNEIISLRPFINRISKIFRIGDRGGYGIYGLARIDFESDTGELHLSYFTPRVLKQMLKKADFIIMDDMPDPYYTAKGAKRIIFDFFFLISFIVRKIFGLNLFDAMLIICRKK